MMKMSSLNACQEIWEAAPHPHSKTLLSDCLLVWGRRSAKSHELSTPAVAAVLTKEVSVWVVSKDKYDSSLPFIPSTNQIPRLRDNLRDKCQAGGMRQRKLSLWQLFPHASSIMYVVLDTNKLQFQFQSKWMKN